MTRLPCQDVIATLPEECAARRMCEMWARVCQEQIPHSIYIDTDATGYGGAPPPPCCGEISRRHKCCRKEKADG
jgi:hypothetical protein